MNLDDIKATTAINRSGQIELVRHALLFNWLHTDTGIMIAAYTTPSTTRTGTWSKMQVGVILGRHEISILALFFSQFRSQNTMTLLKRRPIYDQSGNRRRSSVTKESLKWYAEVV